MHCNDLNQYKDKLRCCFCRNQLTHVDITIKDYKGDFVSVWCPNCKDLPSQWGPKFLICCCGGEPKELEIEMAKGEIALSELNKQVKLTTKRESNIENDNNKEQVAFIPHSDPQPVLDKIGKMFNDDKKKRKKMSNL